MITKVITSFNTVPIYLVKVDAGGWRMASVNPLNPGTVQIALSRNSENVVTIDSTTLDTNTSNSVKAFYESRKIINIIEYLPQEMQAYPELQEVAATEDFELEILYDMIETVFSESTIQYASEEQIIKWELAIKIAPEGTLEQRKMFIMAKLKVQGKLNPIKIRDILDTFGVGEVTMSFANSTLTLVLQHPEEGEIFLFPDISRAIQPLMPAHLSLVVARYYSIWQEIRSNFVSWNSVRALTTWQTVKNYVAP